MTPAEMQALLEQIPLPACLMIGTRIVAANARVLEMTGYTLEQLLDAETPALKFTAPAQQAEVAGRREARLRGEPVPNEFDFQAVTAGGRIIPVRVRISEFPVAGPAAHLFLITDERVRAQAADLIRGFVEVAVAAQQEQTQVDLFRVVRERLGSLGLTSTVMEVEGDNFRIAPFAPAQTAMGVEVRERLGGWVPLARVPVELTSAEGTLIEDLPALLAALTGLPVASYAGKVPPRAVVAAIRIGGGPRFVISCSGENLDSAVAGAFGLLARQLSAALETTQKLEELDRRNAELSLLLELGQEVVSALDVTQVLQAGVRTARKSLRCSSAYVFLPDESGTASFMRIAAREDPEPPPEAEPGSELPLGQRSLTGLAFTTRQLQVSTDNQTDPRIDPELARRFRCNATLAVPLLSHGRALGVLTLFERSQRCFDPLDMRLATHAAHLISSALENARLYAEQRDRAEQMALLYVELERTQKELIDRERLAALGALSASIAHEVRNPLGVIFNSVGSLRRLLKPSGDVALLLDIVGEEADRLNRMVGDLLDYSRPVRPSLEPVPLRPLLDEALAAARGQIGAPAEAVKVEIRIASEAATVRADARLLRQALINLFLNAHQAMPRGGHLDVRANRRVQDGGVVAEIAIRDSGAGIPPEAQEKIFQPFFTTKAMGTGLGLAVVKRIVEGHGGTIVLAGSAAGAEFHLHLPIDA